MGLSKRYFETLHGRAGRVLVVQKPSQHHRRDPDVLTWHLRFVSELKLSEVDKELKKDALFNSLNRIELDRY